jgi:hypothetical protein
MTLLRRSRVLIDDGVGYGVVSVVGVGIPTWLEWLSMDNRMRFIQKTLTVKSTLMFFKKLLLL